MIKKKKFTWKQFDNAVDKLAKQIKHEGFAYDNVYGIPRGGLPLAACLAYRLGLEVVNRPGEHTLICDDINDTGTTLKKYVEGNIAVIHSKESSRVKPEWYAISAKENEWIIYPWETVKSSKLDRK